MLAYKIFGLQPGFDDGLLFHSCVQDLQSHPDLWLDECPYLDPRQSPDLLKRLRVELVNDKDDVFRCPVPAPQQNRHPSLPLAA